MNVSCDLYGIKVYYFQYLFILAVQLFTLLNKYRPETKQAKRQRLVQDAAAKAKNEKATPTPKPLSVVYGLNEVVHAIESKKAKLVAIAHDVDPIEVR